MRFKALLSSLVLASVLVSSVFASPPLLQRGVALGGMHRQTYLYRWTTTVNPTDDRDYQVMASMGMDHVRMPIKFFLDKRFGISLDTLPQTYAEMKALIDPLTVENSDVGRTWRFWERSMAAAQRYGLTTVLDMHFGDSDKVMMEGLATDTVTQNRLQALWMYLAEHFIKINNMKPNQIAFELLNEPRFNVNTVGAYNQLMSRWVAAIRSRIGPDYTLLVHSPYMAAIEGLGSPSAPLLNPAIIAPNDPNMVYVVHYYGPMFITHQGQQVVPWAQDMKSISRLLNLPYPSARAVGRPVCANLLTYPEDVPSADDTCIYLFPGVVTTALGQAQIQAYIDQNWGAERINAEIKVAKDWADALGVKIMLNEFGVNGAKQINADMITGKPRAAGTDAVSRDLWLHDVRTAAENNGMGWTVWEYGDSFAITHKKGAIWYDTDGVERWNWTIAPGDSNPREIVPDSDVVTALGLKQPTTPIH